MRNKDFTVRELAEDPSFRRMVKGIASPEEVENWNQWIEANDENRAKAKEATSFIVGFKFKSPDLPDVEHQWVRLYSKTSGSGKQNKHAALPLYQRRRELNKNKKVRWIYRAVAVFLILSLAGIGGFYFSEGNEAVTRLQQLIEEKTISTSESEQKTLSFSNGAQIVLNSNSTLTYSLGLLQNQTIDISLEGEAWFDAPPDLPREHPAFAVRTPDGIIRDIGTKFLVTIQQGKSRVVLQEGIVEVEPVNGYQGDSGNETEFFRVEKGEMVEFDRVEILKKERVNPTFYTSWATGFMELDETGLEEFAQYIEERFGVFVQLNDPGLADITLDGTVYFRSLDELVRSVSEVTGIPVYRSEDKKTVFIGRMK